MKMLYKPIIVLMMLTTLYSCYTYKEVKIQNKTNDDIMLYTGRGRAYITNELITFREYCKIDSNNDISINIPLINKQKYVFLGKSINRKTNKNNYYYTDIRELYTKKEESKKILTFDSLNKTIDKSLTYEKLDKKPDQELYVVGSGELQKTINQGDKLPASTGIGVFYERKTINNPILKFELEAIINVASNADTIFTIYKNDFVNNKRDFGSYLMSPTMSKQSTYIHYRSYRNELLTKRYLQEQRRPYICGWDARMALSSRVFYDTKDGNNYHASSLYLLIGPFYEFIPQNSQKGSSKDPIDNISITFGISGSFRMLIGDIIQKDNQDFQKKIFNNNKNLVLLGAEPNFQIKLENIVFEATLPVLFNVSNKGTSIPGLSGIQFLTSIRFIGGFPLKVFEN